MIQIGNNIKRIRELKNLTRNYVAENVGLSLKTYSNIENDMSSPDVKTLEKIAESMQVSVFKLFNFDDKVILNNNSKHVENFANTVTHNGSSEKERELYEKNITSLKEENTFLKEQNKLLLSLIPKPNSK